MKLLSARNKTQRLLVKTSESWTQSTALRFFFFSLDGCLITTRWANQSEGVAGLKTKTVLVCHGSCAGMAVPGGSDPPCWSWQIDFKYNSRFSYFYFKRSEIKMTVFFHTSSWQYELKSLIAAARYVQTSTRQISASRTERCSWLGGHSFVDQQEDMMD